MTTSTATRKSVKPVSGRCRWLKPLVLPHGIGRLAITSHTQRGPVTAEYDVEAILNAAGQVVGYHLVKDDDERYHIDTSWGAVWECDCADATFRGRECKHVRSVRAGLARLATPA
jgi:hypothetical protein